jgi:FkbM family methyltransferase
MEAGFVRKIADFFGLIPRCIEIVLPNSKRKACFVNVNDTEEEYIKSFGGEREYFERFVSAIRKGDNILDCGGYHGLYTIVGALLTETGNVTTIDIDDYCCRIIKRNCRMNSVSNVNVLRVAVASQNKMVAVSLGEAHGWSSRLSKIRDIGGTLRKYKDATTVSGQTFDNIVKSNKLEKVDILKVDIEGAEAFVFNDKWSKLVNAGMFGPRIVFLEIHPGYVEQLGYKYDRVIERLRQSGYESVFKKEKANEVNMNFERKRER